MTLGQLETFLAVARSGSVHAAATQRVVSDASVSAAVAALERELGAPLLERRGRGIRLTPAGEELARYAAQALGLLEQGRSAVQAASRPGQGRLRLVAVTTAGEYLIPPILSAFRQRHPGIEVLLEVGNRGAVLARLRTRDADLGIGGRPPVGGDLAGEAVLPNDLVLIAAAGHALTRKRTVDAAALAREVWLLREEGSGTRATTLELMATLGVEPAQVLTLGSNGSVRQGAIVGLGITLLSEQAVARELASGIVARIPAPGLPLRRPWYALYPGPTVEAGTAALTMAARTFVAFLRSREAKRALTAALGAPIHRLNVNRTAKKSR
ncbi:MAG: LysR family transcriptional regulator [Chloroflexi bacterium]|nr:LysR family transcriptional regulator [Chloroflexota bacterium]MDQ3400846.1 LysR family transcriptional regulator [Chloroflexota bacterium]